MKRKTHFPFPSTQSPLIAIVGPTASGKTSLAIDIAMRCNGEIICADSRSIYKGADIGTAKPSLKEQDRVPHWGLDLVNPGDYFTAADFKTYANHRIAEIRSRHHTPLLVGGTGLYIDSVLFDYQFASPVDEDMRIKLQHMTISQLYNYCEKHGITLPENQKNKRYIERIIERNGDTPTNRTKPINNCIVVGIATEKSILLSRISTRCEQLFKHGVAEEAMALGDKYGWDNEAMKSNIYPLIRKYHEGQMSLTDVKDKFVTLDWRLAKRQMTWFKRNKFIRWLSLQDAKHYLIEQLACTEQS